MKINYSSVSTRDIIQIGEIAFVMGDLASYFIGVLGELLTEYSKHHKNAMYNDPFYEWCGSEYGLTVIQETHDAGFKVLMALELDEELFNLFLLKYPPDRRLHTTDEGDTTALGSFKRHFFEAQ